MAIAEDASTPAVVRSASGANIASLTSASFSPPANVLLVVELVEELSTSTTPTAWVVSDSAAGTWTQGVKADPGGAVGYSSSAIYYSYRSAAPGSITVTGGKAAAVARNLSMAVRCVTGAKSTQTGATATVYGTASSSASITTTTTGSLVYVAVGDSVNTTFTATAATTTIDLWNDAGNNSTNAIGKASALTGTPGATTLGWTSSAGTSSFAALEVLPTVIQNVTPTGITTGEAFGTQSLIQNVTAVGIGTGETFGAAALIPALQATGIPSAEVFGVATVDAGIHPSPIPSAEAFGLAAVIPGPVDLSPTGIPSAFATGALVVLGSVLNPAGIGTAEVFGLATLVVGPVDLSPTGIVSGEVFGATVVQQIIVAISSQILIRPAAKTVYELLCVARIPHASDPPTLVVVDPIDWTGLSYSEELSKPSTLSASCSVSSLTEPVLQRLRNLFELASELWLYRNGKLIFAGPWLGWQVQGESLTLNAGGLLTYLRMMVIEADVLFKAVDQFTIVTSLINTWQVSNYGNFGIDTTGIPLSGITQDATYLRKELHVVADRVADLAAGTNGFDLSIDPSSRRLGLDYPQRGVDRSSGQDAIVFDERNVTSPNTVCSVASGDVGSDGFGTGTGGASDALYSTTFNAARRAQYGRTAVTGTFDGALSQTALNERTAAMLAARDQHLLIPGPDVRVTPDSDLGAYDVGDTVSYQLNVQLGVTGAFRVGRRSVTVSRTGQENVSLQFV